MIFSSDPITRTSVFLHEQDGGLGIETVQDVTDILEFTTDNYNQFAHKSNQKFKGDGFHHVASIPLTDYFDIQRQCQGDQEAMEKALRIYLNDPDKRKFRTKPGRI